MIGRAIFNQHAAEAATLLTYCDRYMITVWTLPGISKGSLEASVVVQRPNYTVKCHILTATTLYVWKEVAEVHSPGEPERLGRSCALPVIYEDAIVAKLPPS
jgi:hypothetical protein